MNKYQTFQLINACNIVRAIIFTFLLLRKAIDYF